GGHHRPLRRRSRRGGDPGGGHQRGCGDGGGCVRALPDAEGLPPANAPGAGGDARRLPAPGPAPGQGRGRGRGWGGGRAGGPLLITGPWGSGYTGWGSDVPELSGLGRTLILFGVLLIVVGGLILLAGRLPGIGRLPGDILVRRGSFTFYMPLATSLIVSLLLTLLLNLIFRR